MSWLFFAASVMLIFIAHFLRVERWKLFIAVYERPRTTRLIQALTVGYFLNYFVPLKLGDIVRAGMAGHGMKSGKTLGFSTVIVDRVLDIICVGFIFVVLSLGSEQAKESALFYILMSASILVFVGLCFIFRVYLKRLIRAFASIFNPRIELSFLQFSWALIANFKDIFNKLNKVKLALFTLAMWAGYLASYYCFAAFLSIVSDSVSWVDVFLMLFTENSIASSTLGTALPTGLSPFIMPEYMAAYALLPLVMMVFFSFFIQESPVDDEKGNYLRLLPHLSNNDRRAFLELYFSNTDRNYVINYLKINQNVTVVRDCSAGSNAKTILCMDAGRMFYRKYAFGKDGDKLYQQLLWLEANRGKLPLPEILNSEKNDSYCYYDMPYSSNNVGFFEFMHSMPVDQSWGILLQVLDCLGRSIYRMNQRPADPEIVYQYYCNKVEKNLNRIQSDKCLRSLLSYPTVVINGVEYDNLHSYKRLLSQEHMGEVFARDNYAVIHGDLTIENIITCRGQEVEEKFYLIDPNTGNIHDSLNLDYAKLLQSLHGRYEFMMSTKRVEVSENRVDFLFTGSSVYQDLHRRLHSYMEEHLGFEQTRSIYYHEVIHWLRLLPYKLENDKKRAPMFFAGLLMVMHDVASWYENKGEKKNGREIISCDL